VRLTKFPQSCILLEKDDGGRLLVDPGKQATKAHDFAALGPVDAVLYTHTHADHLDDKAAAAFLDRGTPLYGNADVAARLGGGLVTEVRDGERLSVAGFDVQPVELEHMPMVDGSSGPQNTGFVFDGRCFHPGDGFRVDGLTVETLAVPIAGPSMSFRDAYRFVQQVGARRAVPIHYDVYVADPSVFAARCDIAEVVVLGDGMSVDF
jgi:L-ascorbate metabolism protein UlaG (beta-lactamase superfamily)